MILSCFFVSLVSSLPAGNQLLLGYLACLLHSLASDNGVSRMTSLNLAICWSQTLLKPAPSTAGTGTGAGIGGDGEGGQSVLDIQMRDTGKVVAVVQRLIDHAPEVYYLVTILSNRLDVKQDLYVSRI